MTVYSLLSTLAHPLEIIQRSGFRVADIQYLELYNDYVLLLQEGYKKTYIVAHLAEQYGISERKVYHLLKSYQQPLQPMCSGFEDSSIAQITPPH